MSRIRSDFWVSAYLRRCAGEGAAAVLRRRGAAEAGAIFVSIDRLDGTGILYGPAPQFMLGEGELGRVFTPLLDAPERIDIEERMRREISFDPDLWWVECEDRSGRSFLDLVEPGPA